MSTKLSSIGVFCGGLPGKDPAFVKAAEDLGRAVAKEGLTLVTGAGSAGMMGAVAKAALAAKGKVRGVTTEKSHKANMENQGLSQDQLILFEDLLLVQTMAERKAGIFDFADAIAVLPGGFGTVDELMTVLLLKYIGFMNKPIIIININGFWNFYREIETYLIDNGFGYERYRTLVTFVDKVEDVIPAARKEMEKIQAAEQKAAR